MKNILSFAFIAFVLSGCGPVSQQYQTPPLYFNSYHSVPETDSTGQLAASVRIMLPVNTEIKAEYRLHKNFLINFSHYGNFLDYSNFRNRRGDYLYNTQSFNVGAGMINKIKKSKINWFVLAGYGKGRTTSVVPDEGSPYEFIYKGNFSKITFTPGVELALENHFKLTLSSRQSFVSFNKYELPDTVYYNKKQFLTDMMFGVAFVKKKMSFNFFFGGFINGTEPGNRLNDKKPEIWRIEKLAAGAGFTYKFSLRKGHGEK